MKKVLLSILLAGVGSATFAQKSEIAEAKKAWGIYQLTSATGGDVAKKVETLNAAIKHTDAAIANEKSKILPDAWSYRALLTSAAALADTVNLQQADTYLKTAKEAVDKAKSLDTKGAEKENITQAETNISTAVRNIGVLAYQKKDFKTAYEKFQQATVMNPNDTAMYLNAGIAARNMQDYPKMIEAYRKVISLNHPESSALYEEIITTNLTAQKDTTAAIAAINEAKAKYPDNINFITSETQIYLQKGDVDKAESTLTTLIAKQPGNATFQAALGNVYLQQALKLQTNLNKIDTKKVKEYNAAKTNRDALVEKSVPYFTKALEIDPKNVGALENLKTIYTFKNDTKSYNDVKARLDAIEKK
jgi:tetratricopeptide (TPR) repeat protein